MTREDIATFVVGQALMTAGAFVERTCEDYFEVPAATRLKDVVPGYEATGRHRFLYGVNIAAKGLNLAEFVAADDSATLGDIVSELAVHLPVRLYRCQDEVEPHFYQQWGNGTCRIDGMNLVEVVL